MLEVVGLLGAPLQVQRVQAILGVAEVLANNNGFGVPATHRRPTQSKQNQPVGPLPHFPTICIHAQHQREISLLVGKARQLGNLMLVHNQTEGRAPRCLSSPALAGDELLV